MRILKKPFLLWLIFILLIQLLYWSTREAGFVTDFVGTVERLQDASLSDVFLNTFGFYGLQQINYFLLFIFYQLFGTTYLLGWHLVFTVTHATNALVILLLFNYLFQKGRLQHGTYIALGISLLWLTSPYHTEAVVWRVCYSYLITTLMTFAILLFTSYWLDGKGRKYLFFSQLLFLIALFTFENSFVIPGLTILLLAVFYPSDRIFKREILIGLVGIQLALLFLRLGLSKLLFDSWFAHYGDDVHLNLSLKEWLGAHFKYAAKYLLFTRYQPGKFENGIMQFFNTASGVYWISGFITSLMVIAVIYWQRISFKVKLLIFFILAFVGALLPVHNLYMVTLMHVEGDRLGYFASAFFFGILLILVSYLPRYLSIPVLLVFLSCNIYYLHQTNQMWRGSATVSQSLLDDFHWHDRSELIFLNVPDNFRGAPMFRNITGNQLAFAEAYEYLRKQPIQAKVYEVAQYNMTSVKDGVEVAQDSTNQLKVAFKQYGNWWWRLKLGATNYENNRYRFFNNGDHYIIEFKQPIDSTTILYQDGKSWKEFIPSF